MKIRKLLYFPLLGLLALTSLFSCGEDRWKEYYPLTGRDLCNLIENLEMADFVRGSHEDFGILYKKPEADKVYNAEISFYCTRP